MPPKKASAGTAKKAATSTHASYKDMIKTAIINLKERNGSSRQAIKKYVQANNDLGSTTEAALSTHISAALNSGEKNGDFERPKGPSGPVKLAKKAAPAAKKPAPKAAATTKKPATEKKPAAKKAAPKKTAAAAAPKTAKPKANTAKPRKSAPKKAAAPKAAPAVEEVKPVVLGKTKSGRVTKTTAKPAAQPTKARAKPATKKAPAKKTATPKKAEA